MRVAVLTHRGLRSASHEESRTYCSTKDGQHIYRLKNCAHCNRLTQYTAQILYRGNVEWWCDKCMNEVIGEYKRRENYKCVHCAIVVSPGDTTRYAVASIDSSREAPFCNPCSIMHGRTLKKCEGCNLNTFESMAIQGLCLYCADDQGLIRTCDKCEKTIVVSEEEYCVVGTRRRIYCQACSEHYTRTCDGCEEIFDEDDLECNNDHYYCNACEHDYSSWDASDDVNVHNYEYKPEPVFFMVSLPGCKHQEFSGVELEVNLSYSYAPQVIKAAGKHAYLKNDSTIEDGIEIVTHPHSLGAHYEFWKKFVKQMDEQTDWNTRQGNGIGQHVHIGRDNLSTSQIKNICRFMNHPNNLTYVQGVAERETEGAKNLSQKREDSFINEEPDSETSMVKLASGSRYEGVNLQNDETIEVRIFRSSTKLETILKNVEFCYALLRYAKEAKVTHLEEHGAYQRFIDWVEKQNYPYLSAFHKVNFQQQKALSAA